MDQLVLSLLIYFTQPDYTLAKSWGINEVGNVCLLYDVNGNGKPDVKTCHRKINDGFTKEVVPHNTCQYSKDGIRCTILYQTSGYEYTAIDRPYVYYLDTDEDNVIDYMYIDQEELGKVEDFKRHMDINCSKLCPSWDCTWEQDTK